MTMMNKVVFGIDVGGTAIKYALMIEKLEKKSF